VKKVRSGTPAAGAGIAVRDIIVRVDNQSVGSMGALIVSLRTRKPGDKVSLGYIRDGQWHTVQVTVVQRPKNP
jgi:S1-C subfamily serine protease